MITLNAPSLILLSTLAIFGNAFAQVPSTNDTSLGTNTGMGSGALGGPMPLLEAFRSFPT
jgi:hypothetical protein